MIEPAAPTDGPSIFKISADTGVFSIEELACVEELWNAFLERGVASGYTFLVYRSNNVIEGFACFGPHALTHGAHDIYWIAVEPVAQGKGIGRSLLQAVEQNIVFQGGRLALIETSSGPDYESARQLYHKCGYTLEATVHDFYSPGDHLLIFEKGLSGLTLAANFLSEQEERLTTSAV